MLLISNSKLHANLRRGLEPRLEKADDACLLGVSSDQASSSRQGEPLANLKRGVSGGFQIEGQICLALPMKMALPDLKMI